MEVEEKEFTKGIQATLDDKSAVVRTPWLARVGWIEQFAGMDMDLLCSMTEKPGATDEDWLKQVWDDTGAMLRWCFEGLRDLHTRQWERISFWLSSPSKSAAGKSPMNIYLRSGTVDTYSTYWQKFICFCLRANLNDTRGFQFTQQQLVSLASIAEMYGTNEFNGNEPLRMKRLLLCSIRFIKQSVYEVGTPALIFYSGILGYRKDIGGWRQPEKYTNILAGILWCIRVLGLEYCLPTSSRDRLAEGAEMTPLERFKIFRDEYLVEDTECPFATLHSLLNYGFIIAKDGMGDTMVSWSHDKEVLYIGGNELSMYAWKQFLFQIIDMAEDILIKGLLFRTDGSLPDFNLWENQDDMSSMIAGYYFGRKEVDDWSKYRRAMLEWNLRAEDPYGLIVGNYDDGVAFQQTAVDEYKRKDQDFRDLLYIGMLGTCGPPPRTTEMTSLKYINSDLGKRNIFILGGQIMFVTEYHKSQGIMKRQKVMGSYCS